MIRQYGSPFRPLSQGVETHNPQQIGLLDDEAFTAMMNGPPASITNQVINVTSPPSNNNGTPHSSRIPPLERGVVKYKRRRLPNRRRTKNRGENRPSFGREHREKLKFNENGQAIAPGSKVSKFSRFLGQIAMDSSNFPIDSEDWSENIKNGNAEAAWLKVEEALVWSDPETVKLHDKIKEVTIGKLHDRLKTFRCRLKRRWYKPYAGTVKRFSCGNMYVKPEQWLALVALWDSERNQEIANINAGNRNQLKLPHITGTKSFAQVRHEWELEHPGEELDRMTFFSLAYTRAQEYSANPQPVNEDAQNILDEFHQLQANLQSEGTEIDQAIRDELFYKVMGPEKGNRVRGYGVGVSWADVQGIVTEPMQRNIEPASDVLEEQRSAYEKKEAKMAKELEESAEREAEILSDNVKLKNELEALKKLVSPNFLAEITSANDPDSMETLDVSVILNFLKNLQKTDVQQPN